MSGDGENEGAGEARRLENAAEAWTDVTGEDPRKGVASMDQHAQRAYVAERIREITDKGFSPYVVIEMMLAGACFLGDNFGVSRQQMAKIVATLEISRDRGSMILDPRSRL